MRNIEKCYRYFKNQHKKLFKNRVGYSEIRDMFEAAAYTKEQKMMQQKPSYTKKLNSIKNPILNLRNVTGFKRPLLKEV